MRVIAGRFKSRRLLGSPDLSIRPMTDRVKQTVFDILSNRLEVEGCAVLDLFAGTGSLGIEALSRGAGSVTFVELSRKSIEVLEKNLDSLAIGNEADVAQQDVFSYLHHARRSFDLIFCDPPYKLERITHLPAALHESVAVKYGTWIVMEHGKQSHIDPDETRFDVIRKEYGQTILLILRARKPSQDAL